MIDASSRDADLPPRAADLSASDGESKLKVKLAVGLANDVDDIMGPSQVRQDQYNDATGRSNGNRRYQLPVTSRDATLNEQRSMTPTTTPTMTTITVDARHPDVHL